MSNPFADQPWETSGSPILSEGDHLVTLHSVDGNGTTSGGHPQIEVKMGNAQGEITDWIVVIPTSLFRPVALFAAAGLEKPTDEQVVPDGTGYRIDPNYLGRLVGKQVLVIVRKEPDRNDPTKQRDRVKGYREPGDVASDVPADMSGLGGGTPVAAAAAPGSVPDDDIPF